MTMITYVILSSQFSVIFWDVRMQETKFGGNQFLWRWRHYSDDSWHSGWLSRALRQRITCFRLLIGSPFFRPSIRPSVLTTLSIYFRQLQVKMKYPGVKDKRIKIPARRHLHEKQKCITCSEDTQYVIFWSWEFTLNFRVLRTKKKTPRRRLSRFHIVYTPCVFSHAVLQIL